MRARWRPACSIKISGMRLHASTIFGWAGFIADRSLPESVPPFAHDATS